MGSSAEPTTAAVSGETVRRWIELDPDPNTRSTLEAALQAAEHDPRDSSRLQGLFAGRLAFGTAGLRAELGPGPLRMNRLVVQQTAGGLLTYAERKLAEAHQAAESPHDLGEGSAVRRIVVGFDARHQSDEFAYLTARIFAGAGWQVHLFDRPGPTPLLARQVMATDAEVGVMVTASHNPPRDNGYKVYLGGALSRFLEPHGRGAGAQITAPVDREIAATIAEVVEKDFAADSSTPPVEPSPTVSAPEDVIAIGERERDQYRREALELLDPERLPHRDLRIVYTAMHGVGGEMVTDLLRAGGFEDLIVVPEQHEPDPDFPTADFPNPEEAGALDLALKAAAEHGADLVLANDPDADRLSAAVFDPAQGQWRQLSGDEMGALLGRHILDRGPLRPQRQGSSTPSGLSEGGRGGPVLANSVVSSRLLERLCRVRGVEHAATLTGFKWLARVPDLVFGYEEAIGFNVDPVHVKDKDGVSAALIFAELSAELKAAGTGPVQALDEIAAEAGVFVTGQVTMRAQDLSQLGEVTAQLRADPPAEIAGAAVVESLDLLRDPLPGQEEQAAEPDESTRTDALIYVTEAGDRVIVRPSGTEPKVKCYLEAVRDTPGREAGPEAISLTRDRAAARLAELHEAMSALLAEPAAD